MGAVEGFQQLRWQQHGADLCRSPSGGSDRAKSGSFRVFEQVQADVAVAQLMAGQGRGQQHQRIVVGRSSCEKRHEGFVQRTQPAPFDPARQQQQQVIGATQRRQARQAVRLPMASAADRRRCGS